MINSLNTNPPVNHFTNLEIGVANDASDRVQDTYVAKTGFLARAHLATDSIRALVRPQITRVSQHTVGGDGLIASVGITGVTLGALGSLAGFAVPLAAGIQLVIPEVSHFNPNGIQNLSAGIPLIVLSATGVIPTAGLLAGAGAGTLLGLAFGACCCNRDF